MSSSRYFLLCAFICLCAGCANITAPTGGKKDTIPPRLLEVDPADSLLNTRVQRIEMDFDEYITVSDVSKEVALSPILSVPPTVTGRNKHVTIKIPDTLLEENTTYRLSLGKAIKDLHEGNAFTGYTYTFSTGAYFDSLQLAGTVINAATGLPDTGGIIVVLYSAKDNDSAIVRHKPKYVTRPNAQGEFIFKGLPGRSFRIYAMKDANGNMIYDGPADNELIAFNDEPVTPGLHIKVSGTGADTTFKPILLKLFAEVPDTSIKKNTDTTTNGAAVKGKNKNKQNDKNSSGYAVNNLDTTNATRRTFDITKPINLVFTQQFELNNSKITLTYDSGGTTVKPPVSIVTDSLHPRVIHIYPGVPDAMTWAEDQVYTLRLAKGFAKDTAGKDLMPSRYVFHTKEDEDYGKITIHLPEKYYGRRYLMMVTADQDTVYLKPVTDTFISLVRLKPAKYTFRIIVDKNGNGKWDTGDLFGKKQPEEVIPYPEAIMLRPGFEQDFDFEQKPPEKKSDNKDNIKPK